MEKDIIHKAIKFALPIMQRRRGNRVTTDLLLKIQTIGRVAQFVNLILQKYQFRFKEVKFVLYHLCFKQPPLLPASHMHSIYHLWFTINNPFNALHKNQALTLKSRNILNRYTKSVKNRVTPSIQPMAHDKYPVSNFFGSPLNQLIWYNPIFSKGNPTVQQTFPHLLCKQEAFLSETRHGRQQPISVMRVHNHMMQKLSKEQGSPGTCVHHSKNITINLMGKYAYKNKVEAHSLHKGYDINTPHDTAKVPSVGKMPGLPIRKFIRAKDHRDSIFHLSSAVKIPFLGTEIAQTNFRAKNQAKEQGAPSTCLHRSKNITIDLMGKYAYKNKVEAHSLHKGYDINTPHDTAKVPSVGKMPGLPIRKFIRAKDHRDSIFHLSSAVKIPFLGTEIAQTNFRAKNQAKHSLSKGRADSNALDGRSAIGAYQERKETTANNKPNSRLDSMTHRLHLSNRADLKDVVIKSEPELTYARMFQSHPNVVNSNDIGQEKQSYAHKTVVHPPLTTANSVAMRSDSEFRAMADTVYRMIVDRVKRERALRGH